MASTSEMKSKLLFVCNKIDEILKQNRELKSKENPIKPQEDIIPDNSPNYIAKINSLKSQMESLQKNLEEIYNIDRINQIESEIKEKENILKTLKNESKILNFAVKEQNKGIQEYISKFDSTKELKELSEQLKNIKEENHSYKATFKDISNRIKLQETNIEKLENKCKKIKQNIEFQKKKQMKEVQKTLNENNIEKEEDEYGDNIEKMEEAEKNLINEINIEEKDFRIEINEENQVIKNINNEILNINNKLKQLKNEKKLEEITKKNRKKTKSTTKYRPNNKSDKDKNNIPIKDNKRRLSNYKPKQNPNLEINLKNNKTNNTEKRTHLQTPNLLDKKSEKITKPFEIGKFNSIAKDVKSINDEKNNTMFNLKKYEKQKKKNNNGKGASALKEIENLKSEIQKALKNNIVILDIDDIKNNYYKNEKDEEIFSAYQTGRFGKQVNNEDKGSEVASNNEVNENNNINKKSIIQNEKRIQDYNLNKNENINEESSKRKPFDKIIFK